VLGIGSNSCCSGQLLLTTTGYSLYPAREARIGSKNVSERYGFADGVDCRNTLGLMIRFKNLRYPTLLASDILKQMHEGRIGMDFSGIDSL
jgi:hypothetical protein